MVQDQDNLTGPQIVEDVASLKGVIAPNGVNSLWGIAPTAPIHLGYDSLIVAQKEMLILGLAAFTLATPPTFFCCAGSEPQVRK